MSDARHVTFTRHRSRDSGLPGLVVRPELWIDDDECSSSFSLQCSKETHGIACAIGVIARIQDSAAPLAQLRHTLGCDDATQPRKRYIS